jgi:hypothetical protein
LACENYAELLRINTFNYRRGQKVLLENMEGLGIESVASLAIAVA